MLEGKEAKESDAKPSFEVDAVIVSNGLVDPAIEEEYWREHFKTAPYYAFGIRYEDYSLAYQYGWESANRPEYSNRTFEEVETDLKNRWFASEVDYREDWCDVRDAIRDAYNRIRRRRILSQ
jgi:hypothetical protein